MDRRILPIHDAHDETKQRGNRSHLKLPRRSLKKGMTIVYMKSTRMSLARCCSWVENCCRSLVDESERIKMPNAKRCDGLTDQRTDLPMDHGTDLPMDRPTDWSFDRPTDRLARSPIEWDGHDSDIFGRTKLIEDKLWVIIFSEIWIETWIRSLFKMPQKWFIFERSFSKVRMAQSNYHTMTTNYSRLPL